MTSQLVNRLFHTAQNYFTQFPYGVAAPQFRPLLRAILGWPNVPITVVELRDENGQTKPVGRIEDFLEYIRKDAAPGIWLKIALEPRTNLNDPNQADYSRHPALQLETWVDTLTEQDAAYATSLFTLLRRNHYRSRDFVEDLVTLFAPFKQLNDTNSERSRSLLEIFDGPTQDSSHASHLAKIESLATELEGTLAGDARAVLYLIRRGFRTCRDSMNELKVIFTPLQLRNVEELERAVQIKKVFEAIDKEAEVMDVA